MARTKCECSAQNKQAVPVHAKPAAIYTQNIRMQ